MMYSKIKLLSLTFQKFLNNNNGQIAIMMAVLLLPITIFIGASIDWSQKLNAESKMQSTIDSAILAVARQLTVKKQLNASEMNSIAQTVFDTNISVPSNVSIANFEITYQDDLLKITQTAEVDTTFLKLIDISTMYIDVISEVVVKFEGVDIALAVDLSGSMGGNKIQHLRSATASLLEELSYANLDEIRVAFVPWTRGVNLEGHYYQVTQYPDQGGQPQARVMTPQARVINTPQANVTNTPQANVRNLPQARTGGGQNNNGQNNSGDHNNGNDNSGNHNNGNSNSGNYNNGSYNTGNNNNGNENSGDHNSGNQNSGNHNNGNQNSGNYNNGSNNTGNNNNGNENSGDHNNGNENSGNHNNGNNNHGNYNNGSYNHGNNNNGNYNMGNFNNGNGTPSSGGGSSGGGSSGGGSSGGGSSGGGSSGGGSSGGGSSGGGSSGGGTPDEPENTCVGTREDGTFRANDTTIDHPLEHQCPSAKLIPLTDILEVKNGKTGRKRLEDIANSWTTRGGTGSHNGLYWAAATLNTAFYPVFGTKTPAEPDAIKKYIIIMTDGLNNKSEFNTQMLAACTQAKAQGISIYSIVLMENSQTVINTFRDCASSDASGRRFFIQTNNSALLKEDFRRIVGEIGQFYLSK